MVAEIDGSDVQALYESSKEKENTQRNIIPSAFKNRLPDSDDETSSCGGNSSSNDDDDGSSDDDGDIAYDDNECFEQELRQKLAFDPALSPEDAALFIRKALGEERSTGSILPGSNILGSKNLYVPTSKLNKH